MGLDMYLTKKTYIGAEYEHRNVKGKIELTQGSDNKPIPIQFNRVSYIEENVGYWRKANQIHAWFVANVQDGQDDCGTYEVSEDQLKSLLSVCLEIKEKCTLVKGQVRNGQHVGPDTGGKWVDNIEDGELMQNSSIAAQLLPTASGFFFGSTDYDQYYMQDIDDTIEIIQSLLQEREEINGKSFLSGDIYYHSSW